MMRAALGRIVRSGGAVWRAKLEKACGSRRLGKACGSRELWKAVGSALGRVVGSGGETGGRDGDSECTDPSGVNEDALGEYGRGGKTGTAVADDEEPITALR